MGSAAATLRWLAARLGDWGLPLVRGQVILTGSALPLFPVQPGDRVITEAHPISRGNHGHAGLHEIDYTALRKSYAGRHDVPRKPRRDGWHTDVTFMETPPMGSILNAPDSSVPSRRSR